MVVTPHGGTAAAISARVMPDSKRSETMRVQLCMPDSESEIRSFVKRKSRHPDAAAGNNGAMGSIGQRIRAERKAAGLTIKEFAAKVGLATSTLTELELGESASTTKLHRIAEELHVSVSWLETGRGPKTLAPTQDSERSADAGRQARSVRPDAATMALAYKAVLIHSGLAERIFYPTRDEDMAVVCDAYAIIAAGGGVLPGEPDASRIEAAVQRLSTRKGDDSGKATKPVSRHRTTK
jgi:transcriptional regulator with XRE-family HTH domain